MLLLSFVVAALVRLVVTGVGGARRGLAISLAVAFSVCLVGDATLKLYFLERLSGIFEGFQRAGYLYEG